MAITREQNDRLTEMLAELEPHLSKLNNFEQGFVGDQIARHKKYGDRIYMSEKQWKLLGKIYEDAIGDTADVPDEKSSDRATRKDYALDDDEIPF